MPGQLRGFQSLQPWVWRSLPLGSLTTADVFARAFYRPGEISVFLESPPPSGPNFAEHLARYSLCAGPPRPGRCWTPAIGEIFPFLANLLAPESTAIAAETNASADIPFQGGWVGWLGYDAAWEIERLPQLNPDPLPFPVAFWYEPAEFAWVDRLTGQVWLAAGSAAACDRLQARLEQPALWTPGSDPNAVKGPGQTARVASSQQDYEAMVRQAKAYIRAGEIFQANLSLRFSATTHRSSWALYRTLQQLNPSPFASFWQTPWGDLMSCSPERLLQVERQPDGYWCQTRPIAGTRPRGKTPDRDRQLAAELQATPKELAEHIMLVDLERNDLGRVCAWGSVEVDELLAIERYSHVMHLVSNVRGRLRGDRTSAEAIAALFPGGTITGCPKVRCMEIIEELEPLRRNLFYGSCGYLDWRGNLDLNILIRTLLRSGDMVWGQVGAGIVADSDPTREWLESLDKARAQLAALQTQLST